MVPEASLCVVVLAVHIGGHGAPDRDLPGTRQHRHPESEGQQGAHQPGHPPPLAPLLGNNRRRIELMNGLMFALPGTPVVYYGDEIGHGRQRLPGRPQRRPDAHAVDRATGTRGSRRPTGSGCILPPIVDPEYHYEAVNVEAQQANPALAAVVDAPADRAPRAPRGVRPRDDATSSRATTGRSWRSSASTARSGSSWSPTSRATRSGRSLDLAEHRRARCRWRCSARSTSRPSGTSRGSSAWVRTASCGSSCGTTGRSMRRGGPPPRADPGAAGVAGGARRAATRRGADAGPPDVAPRAALVPRTDPAHPLVGRRHGGDPAVPSRDTALAIVEVELHRGDPERYLAGARAVRRPRCGEDDAVPDRATSSRDGQAAGHLVDAATDPAVGRWLLGLIGGRGRARGRDGELVGRPTKAVRGGCAPRRPRPPCRPSAGEQSNSSVVLDDGLILKLYPPVIESGENPDLEIGPVPDRAGFPQRPVGRRAGSSIGPADGERPPRSRCSSGSSPTRATSGRSRGPRSTASSSASSRASEAPPVDTGSVGRRCWRPATAATDAGGRRARSGRSWTRRRLLGPADRRAARALAERPDDAGLRAGAVHDARPALAVPVGARPGRRAWRGPSGRQLPKLPAGARDRRARRVLGAAAAGRGSAAAAPRAASSAGSGSASTATTTWARCSGPARDIVDHRLRGRAAAGRWRAPPASGPALTDVAGMIRSFHYAAHGATGRARRHRRRARPGIARLGVDPYWYVRSRRRSCAGYRAATAGSEPAPRPTEDWRRLLDALAPPEGGLRARVRAEQPARLGADPAARDPRRAAVGVPCTAAARHRAAPRHATAGVPHCPAMELPLAREAIDRYGAPAPTRHRRRRAAAPTRGGPPHRRPRERRADRRARRRSQAGELAAMGLLDEIFHAASSSLQAARSTRGGDGRRSPTGRSTGRDAGPTRPYRGARPGAAAGEFPDLAATRHPSASRSCCMSGSANVEPGARPAQGAGRRSRAVRASRADPASSRPSRATSGNGRRSAPSGLTLVELLRRPAIGPPDSLAGQLRWIRDAGAAAGVG